MSSLDKNLKWKLKDEGIYFIGIGTGSGEESQMWRDGNTGNLRLKKLEFYTITFFQDTVTSMCLMEMLNISLSLLSC